MDLWGGGELVVEGMVLLCMRFCLALRAREPLVRNDEVAQRDSRRKNKGAGWAVWSNLEFFKDGWQPFFHLASVDDAAQRSTRQPAFTLLTLPEALRMSSAKPRLRRRMEGKRVPTAARRGPLTDRCPAASPQPVFANPFPCGRDVNRWPDETARFHGS